MLWQEEVRGIEQTKLCRTEIGRTRPCLKAIRGDKYLTRGKAVLVTTKGFFAGLEFYCEGDVVEVDHMCRVKSMHGRAEFKCIFETLRPTVAWWYSG